MYHNSLSITDLKGVICSLFSVLETEVFVSAFHWEKCLIVNISELFQYKCSNLDKLELFGFLTHA